MKIIEVAPIYESIPPIKYGGIESMLAGLIDGLIARDVDIEVITSKDSQIKATVQSIFKNSYNKLIQSNSTLVPQSAAWAIDFQNYITYQNCYADLIHNHYHGADGFSKIIWAKAFSDRIPTIFTIHNDIRKDKIGTIMYDYFSKNTQCIFLSKAQRRRHKEFKSLGIIYNGIDTRIFINKEKLNRNYFYWIGNIIPEKGLYDAIDIIHKHGLNLKISGRIEPYTHKEYWKSLKQLIDGHKIRYIGESNQNEKIKLYQNAKAMLFTSTHQEGCPMVLLESLSCGTPIIAYNNPVVEEIITDGKHGFICKDNKDLYKAIKKINNMSSSEYQKMRLACRKHVEDNFTVEKMVDSYERVYKKVIEDWKKNHSTIWETGVIETAF